MKLWEGTRKHMPQWEYWGLVFKLKLVVQVSHRLKKLSGYYAWCLRRYNSW